MSAVLSDCGTYRYALWRDIPPTFETVDTTVLFVMLNPSTADAAVDDPTIRRCIGFASDWNHSRLAVGNLFALRSTDPGALLSHDDPIGPENDAWLERLAGEASEVIFAWGAHAAAASHRGAWVPQLFANLGVAPMCLGKTAHGFPRHPLYLDSDTEPEPYA